MTAQDGKQVLPKGKQRLFRAHNSKDANFYEVFSPALRDESIKRGFNAILQRIEFACGLATEHFLTLRRSIKRRKKYEPASSALTARLRAYSVPLRLRLTIWCMRWIS